MSERIDLDAGWAMLHPHDEGVTLTSYGWGNPAPAQIRHLSPAECITLSRALVHAAAEVLGVGE